jgi:hypothetical protein
MLEGATNEIQAILRRVIREPRRIVYFLEINEQRLLNCACKISHIEQVCVVTQKVIWVRAERPLGNARLSPSHSWAHDVRPAQHDSANTGDGRCERKGSPVDLLFLCVSVGGESPK